MFLSGAIRKIVCGYPLLSGAMNIVLKLCFSLFTILLICDFGILDRVVS